MPGVFLCEAHFGPSCHDSSDVTLPCGHAFPSSRLAELIWRQSGCDVDGEEGEADCAQCKKEFSFQIRG